MSDVALVNNQRVALENSMCPPTPGVPPSFAEALEDWVGTTSTPFEEIAEIAGCEVAEVQRCLDLGDLPSERKVEFVE